MNKSKIEKYFSGETSGEEESELLQYFSSEEIAPEHIQYQSYFLGLANLKTNSKLIIPQGEYEKVTYSSKTYTYYLKRFGVSLAVAASIALFILFLPFLHRNQNFVVINGKKYTDEKQIHLALQASLENVKIDVKQIFNELDNDLFN
jgi:hypothetical protein